MTQEEDIKNAVKVLRDGGVILYPTDTVWGIGCDATNAEAVAKATSATCLQWHGTCSTWP